MTTTACLEQIEAATKLYRLRRNWSLKTSLTKYNNPTVKTALEAMFHGKCAYCESIYTRVGPMDVEHYRPKGGVVIEGSVEAPGYYWLAASWDNLLPSCRDCNRNRRHLLLDGSKEVAGKKNQFPISNTGPRRRWHTAKRWKAGIEKEENPLLLNPCNDFPEKHLMFDDAGNVLPTQSRTGRESVKGKETIRVCALFRPNLIQARRDMNKRHRSQVDAAADALGEFDAQPAQNAARTNYADELRSLTKMRDDEAEYALMARQLIDPALGTFAKGIRRHRAQLDIRMTNGARNLIDRFVVAYASPPEPPTAGELAARLRAIETRWRRR
ncbi:MAG: hypothetical protein GY720_20515 [bacterium]|nr:hypothetical protein [bacterium]